MRDKIKLTTSKKLRVGSTHKFFSDDDVVYKVFSKKVLKNDEFTYIFVPVKVKSKASLKRKKNPVLKTKGKIKDCIKLFKRFREEEPEFIDEIIVPTIDVAMLIGTCDGILYTTRRNGKV